MYSALEICPYEMWTKILSYIPIEMLGKSVAPVCLIWFNIVQCMLFCSGKLTIPSNTKFSMIIKLLQNTNNVIEMTLYEIDIGQIFMNVKMYCPGIRKLTLVNCYNLPAEYLDIYQVIIENDWILKTELNPLITGKVNTCLFIRDNNKFKDDCKIDDRYPKLLIYAHKHGVMRGVGLNMLNLTVIERDRMMSQFVEYLMWYVVGESDFNMKHALYTRYREYNEAVGHHQPISSPPCPLPAQPMMRYWKNMSGYIRERELSAKHSVIDPWSLHRR